MFDLYIGFGFSSFTNLHKSDHSVEKIKMTDGLVKGILVRVPRPVQTSWPGLSIVSVQTHPELPNCISFLPVHSCATGQSLALIS